MTDLAQQKAEAAIEEMRANIEHMIQTRKAQEQHWQAEREKWQKEGRRDLWRLVVYTLIGSAALLVAGAAIWEVIRPAGLP